jgi:hypothetical protein
MSTMTTPARPVAAEPAAAYAVRGRRQAVAVLTVATLLGVWLGTSAPSVPPVATTPAPAVGNAVIQDPAVLDPAPPGPAWPNGAGRRR